MNGGPPMKWMHSVVTVLRVLIAASALVLIGGRAVAESPGVVIDWPRLPRQQAEPPAVGPVEPAATRSDVPRIGTGQAPESNDDRRLREREAAARERTRAALEEQDRRIGRAVAAPVAAPAMTLQNCGPAGCFDAQGRFLPRAGPALITPSGQPCMPSAGGTGC
jgi:hypothetical protein